MRKVEYFSGIKEGKDYYLLVKKENPNTDEEYLIPVSNVGTKKDEYGRKYAEFDSRAIFDEKGWDIVENSRFNREGYNKTWYVFKPTNW